MLSLLRLLTARPVLFLRLRLRADRFFMGPNMPRPRMQKIAK
jgi:hypothetical protein